MIYKVFNSKNLVTLLLGEEMDSQQLAAENKTLRELLAVAAVSMGKAHRSMFEQCLSNPIRNEWGKSVNVLAINELQDVANKIAKKLGDIDLFAAVYAEPCLYKESDDFTTFFNEHGSPRPSGNEMIKTESSEGDRNWAKKFWDGASDAKDSVIVDLKRDLAMAQDAANKGDSARMTAGGMDMKICELGVEVSKRDALLNDMRSELSSLAHAKSSVPERLVQAFNESLDDIFGHSNRISNEWNGKSGKHESLLPPVGSRVSIFLSSNGKWIDHVVSGYYVWGNLGNDTNVHRVFVTVRDSEGYPNARLLNNVRPAGFSGPEFASDSIN